MAGREQSRRRVLLWSIAALTVLSISPVVGHHLSVRADETLLGGIDMIGTICLVALHMLLAPLHDLFHLALAGGLAYATWDRARAWFRMRRVLGRLNPQPLVAGGVIARSVAAVDLDPRRVRVVSGLPNPAFTVGLIRPNVYVAAELADWLPESELQAVLAHEGAHLARRDPLRLSMLRFCACTLFWIPVLRRLAADVADEAEVQADDVAAREQPLVLASAILNVAAWGRASSDAPSNAPSNASASAPATDGASAAGTDVLPSPHGREKPSPPPPKLAAIVCHDMVERRVRRLAGEDARSRTHVTRRSLLGAMLILLLGWGSGVVMAHPLPVAEQAMMGGHAMAETPSTATQHAHAGHCSHHTGNALSHLWCGHSASLVATGASCPHRAARALVMTDATISAPDGNFISASGIF